MAFGNNKEKEGATTKAPKQHKSHRPRKTVTTELGMQQRNKSKNLKIILASALVAIIVFIALQVIQSNILNREEKIKVYVVSTAMTEGTKITEETEIYKLKDFISRYGRLQLDVEKSIAHILFENGEKDSAYIMLKNNLDKIEDYGAKHSYYTLLGEFYYHDNKYDSAICYLEQGLESQFFYTKLNASIRLSSIYDSLNNNSKKAYYDNIISQLSIDKIEKNSDNLKLQNIYDEYKERKYEREKLNNKNSYIYSTIAIIIVINILTVVSIFRNKQKNIRFSNLLKDKENIIKQISKEIQQKENYIKSLEFKQSLTEGKIKNNNTKLHNQEELIKNYQLEIIELKKQLEKNISCISNLNGYYQSEICFQILKQIEKLSEKNIDTSRLNALKQEEFVLLLKSANIFLNDIFNDMANKYHKKKKEDLYYLCLVIINLNDKQISSLFGVSYNSIKIRKRKICSIFDIRTDEINIVLRMGQLQ